MVSFIDHQSIKQLEKRKGGYYYLKLDSEIVNQFVNKKATRIICAIDDKISFRCGLNHLGDGHFFIIIAARHLAQIQKQPGDTVKFSITVDPDPLGVDVPEVLEVLLLQDETLKEIYDRITDGKKRTLIYSISRIKDIDIQIEKIITFLHAEKLKMK